MQFDGDHVGLVFHSNLHFLFLYVNLILFGIFNGTLAPLSRPAFCLKMGVQTGK